MKKSKRNNRWILWLALCLIGGGIAGCGGKETMQLSDAADTRAESGAEETADEAGKAGADGETEAAEENAEGEKQAAEAETATLSVYVCGAVNAPGVYELPAGSRLYQAVEAAGGMRQDADREYLNLAMELSDGEKLQVPTEEEVRSGTFAATGGAGSIEDEKNAGSGENAGKGGQTASGDGRVNINTADKTLLMTLPGVGEAKAESILSYRKENGGFKKIEDIMNIPGIKEAVYEKLKDAICVE